MIAHPADGHKPTSPPPTQDILGHASTDTTRVYAELDVEHLRRAHRKAFGG